MTNKELIEKLGDIKALLKEISEWPNDYSSTVHKMQAKKLLSELTSLKQTKIETKDEWVNAKEELIQLSDNIYSNLPTEKVKTWDVLILLKMIKDRLDVIIGKLPKAPDTNQKE
jgi:hypothetical protein